MAVFEVLAEMVGSIEFLRLIALSKFVDLVEVGFADVPLGRIGKVLTAVAAGVGVHAVGGRMKGCMRTREHSTRPRMFAEV